MCFSINMADSNNTVRESLGENGQVNVDARRRKQQQINRMLSEYSHMTIND